MGVDRKKAFLVYCDYKQHLELLSLEECGKLFLALLNYAETAEPTHLTGAAAMAFSFIKAQMDRDEQKYEERCATNRENGAKGGRPRKQAVEDETKENPSITEKTKRFIKKPKKPDTDKDKDDDYDTGNGIDCVSHTGQKEFSKNVSQDFQFEEFWNAYPKKVAKSSCLKAWKKLNPDQILFDKIIQAVFAQKHSDQWTRDGGRFIPNPLTWLNQGRWDDIISELPSSIGRNTDTISVIQNIISEESEGMNHDVWQISRNGTPEGFKDE